MTIEFEIEKTGEWTGFTWPTFSTLVNHIYHYYSHEQFHRDCESIFINAAFSLNAQPQSVFTYGLLKLISLGTNEGEFTLKEIEQILIQMETVPMPHDDCLRQQFLKLYQIFYKANLLRSYITIS